MGYQRLGIKSGQPCAKQAHYLLYNSSGLRNLSQYGKFYSFVLDPRLNEAGKIQDQLISKQQTQLNL